MPKKNWTTEEEKKLLILVNDYITKDKRIGWKIISNKMGNKSASSCFSHYTRCLSPLVFNRNREWTWEEDKLICKSLQEKKTWSEIKSLLPGRSDISIFNRWRSLVKKNNDHAKSKQNINTYRVQPSITDMIAESFNNHLNSQLNYFLSIKQSSPSKVTYDNRMNINFIINN